VRVSAMRAAGDDYQFTVEHVGTRMRRQLASTAELIAFFDAVLHETDEREAADQPPPGGSR
jgi:hypothetical protein